MNLNEKLIRHYVREILISERQQTDVRRRGQGAEPPNINNALGFIAGLRDMFRSAVGVISGLTYAGIATYKNVESVFKVGAEGMSGILTGNQPDYESIVTNQAATLRKARGFLGRDQPRPGLVSDFLKKEAASYGIDTFCLDNMSLQYLIEADDPTPEEIVDDAVDDAAEEIEDQLEDPSQLDDLQIGLGQDISPVDIQAVGQEVLGDPEDLGPEVADEMIQPEEEFSEEDVESALDDVIEEPPPPLDPSQAFQVAEELASSARLDMESLMIKYDSVMASKDLKSLAREIATIMGRPAAESSFTPEGLSQSVLGITGQEVSPDAIRAGSEDLFIQLKDQVPNIFSGIIGGSFNSIMDSIDSDPTEVRDAIAGALTPVYNAALQRIGSTESVSHDSSISTM